MKRIQIEQNTPEWEEFRRTRIGASDVSVIMTGSEQDKYDLYLRKKTGGNKPVTFAMQRGHELEPEAKAWTEFVMGREYEKVTAVHDSLPWLMASFDGYDEKNNEVLEIKCPSVIPDRIEDAKYWESYYWQMQAQMCVAGAERGVLTIYSPEKQVCGQVVRNSEDVQKLIDAAAMFYSALRGDIEYKPPYEERVDTEFFEAVEAWKLAKQRSKEALEEEARRKSEIIQIAGEKACRGNGALVYSQTREGAVDYAQIPQLRGVDLKPFRKASFTFWSVREI